MQSGISMEDSYQGVTQDERMLLRQLFDKTVKGIVGTPDLPRELSSNQGENDDNID